MPLEWEMVINVQEAFTSTMTFWLEGAPIGVDTGDGDMTFWGEGRPIEQEMNE